MSLRHTADKWCQKGERGLRRWLRKENHLTSSFALCLAGNNTDRCFICLWLGEGFRFWLYGCWLQTDKKFRFCLFSWKAWRYHLENPMAFSISLTNLWCLLRVKPVKSWLCSQRSWWKLNNTAPTGQLVLRQETMLSCRRATRVREGGVLSKAGLCSHAATVFIIFYCLHLASSKHSPSTRGQDARHSLCPGEKFMWLRSHEPKRAKISGIPWLTEACVKRHRENKTPLLRIRSVLQGMETWADLAWVGEAFGSYGPCTLLIKVHCQLRILVLAITQPNNYN